MENCKKTSELVFNFSGSQPRTMRVKGHVYPGDALMGITAFTDIFMGYCSEEDTDIEEAYDMIAAAVARGIECAKMKHETLADEERML